MNTKTETQLEFDFVKPNQLTLNFDENYKFSTDLLINQNLQLHNPKAYSVIFYKGDKTVGTLTWKDGPMRFEGDAEESAQLFFDNIIKVYTQTKLDFKS
jgi:hypothetical protein